MAEPAIFTELAFPSFCKVPAATFVILLELLLLFRIPIQRLHPFVPARSLQRSFLSFVFLTTCFFSDFFDFFFLFFFVFFLAFGSWTKSPSRVTWLNLQSSPNLHSPASAK